ncbi:hypothetical protein [Deinococcus misasensis]|uniref:hypothetical protein n=1 Tax=Deinococcus misasensis TaxID=392413 RepID=UPI00054E8F75|nr:hypothetical protein [Deinococcus misasensis]
MTTATHTHHQPFLEQYHSHPREYLQNIQNVLEQHLKDGTLHTKERLIVTPPVLTSMQHQELRHIHQTLNTLLFSLQDRLFGGSHQKLARYAGFSEQITELFLDPHNAQHNRTFLRGDLYHTEDGWKLTELNVGSAIGGHHIDHIFRSLDQTPAFQSLKAHQQRYESAWLWAEMVKGFLQDHHKPQGQTAIFDTQDSVDKYLHMYSPHAHDLTEKHGIPAQVCAPRDLTLQEDGLYAGSTRLDFIYRFFNLLDILHSPRDVKLVIEAWQKGLIQMPVDFRTRMYGSKAMLALMSDPRNHGHFTDEEIKVIENHLPWTRMLTEENLPEAQKLQGELVLKPTDGLGGLGVIFGQDLTPQAWQQTLIERLKSSERHVLQKQIKPSQGQLVAWSPQTGFQEDSFNLLYGAFMMNGTFSGAFLRASPASGSKIINYANGSFLSPVYFEGQP